ncbi:MAG: sigma-70 family RNA polymerase sigma factor [Verrucomicrobia bacterium]|nr:sigma-70 family RNA polymerase sigma factor [Verrucomicrobiota bacterium]
METEMLATDTYRTEVDDLALVEAVQRGELQAFEPLLDRHLDHVHAFISLRLPVPHLADEITHETFVFAFRHIHEFSAGTAFRSWLRAIAANKIRAEIERYCREEANKLNYAEHRLIEAAINEPDAQSSREVEALNHCLEKVPDHLRELLTLKYHDEQPTVAIAQRLQRSLAWVRTTLCRLRQQLRACIETALAREHV